MKFVESEVRPNMDAQSSHLDDTPCSGYCCSGGDEFGGLYPIPLPAT